MTTGTYLPVGRGEFALLQVYAYYYEKGFICSVASKVTHALYADSFRQPSRAPAGDDSGCRTIAFTVAYSALLLLFIDWAGAPLHARQASCTRV